jgi:hypothetical protein
MKNKSGHTIQLLLPELPFMGHVGELAESITLHAEAIPVSIVDSDGLSEIGGIDEDSAVLQPEPPLDPVEEAERRGYLKIDDGNITYHCRHLSLPPYF